MNYWQRRQQQLNKQLEKDEEKLKKRLSSYFDAEYRKLEKDIAAYYEQYGIDHVIQYRNLMEEFPEADKRLLMEQMDEFAEKYPEYASLMPVRESIYRLNRLEGLQYSVRMQQLEIGAIENEQISEHLQRNAERGVNAAAETMGFGKNFYANHPDIARLFVNTAWSDGENFSQKIWNNTSKLANYLNTDIAQGFARGDSYERLTRKLRERFGKVSRNDVYRLIYTEGTYIMAEATMQPFTDDFEQYRLSTAADGKVCSICRSIAQEVFNISDRQPGINFPPLHPWCRCTFMIEVNDWDAWMDEYEQRHRDGQAKKIANRLENDKEDVDIIKNIKRRIKRISDHDPVSLYNIKSEYKDDIIKVIEKSPDKIKSFLMDHQEEIVFINEKSSLGNSESPDGIRINLKNDFINERGRWCSTFHEIGHRVDRIAGRPSEDLKFEKSLRSDFENIVNSYRALYNKNKLEAYIEIGESIKGSEFHSISDLFGGMSNNECIGSYLHSNPGYWSKAGRLGREAFAHFFEATARNDSKKIALLKQTFPTAYELFEQMWGGL